MTSREAYIDKMKEQLDELNTRMNKLDAKAVEAREEVRGRYHEEMKKLRHQSKQAVAKLDELVATSEDGWDKMVNEMDKVRDAFTHSFHYFKSQI